MIRCGNELLYLAMPKTGSSFVEKVLEEQCGGQRMGLHEPPSRGDVDEVRHVCATVRNPWDWYLSLWAYGTKGYGAVYSRLTERRLRKALRQFRGDVPAYVSRVINEWRKRPEYWRQLYRSPDDANAFRAWLKGILRPRNAVYLHREFADSPLRGRFGFMTFRYLRLCCFTAEEAVDAGVAVDVAAIAKLDARRCFVDSFIRQENLRGDLLALLESRFGFDAPALQELVPTARLNASGSRRPLHYYYDEGSRDLVAEREAFIVRKFGYSFAGSLNR